jgi:glycine amidinotransferase
VRLHSYDEWSVLREVVVGSAKNYVSHHRELSFELFFHENLINDNDRSEWYYPRLTPLTTPVSSSSPIKQRYVEELVEDLEGIAETLRSLGVLVHRPMDLPAEQGDVQAPGWRAPITPPLNVRDNTLILGDEIIETAPMIRSRYFETHLLKPIFQHYFRQGARWSVMPRPIMADSSFDLGYAQRATIGGPTEPITLPRSSGYDVGIEMMFDAAQCLRLGRDIVANISTSNHAKAVDWLERHLEDRFRIHRVYELSDSHIDSMVLALRPGTLLVRSAEVARKLPEALQKWDLIVAPPPTSDSFPHYDDEDLVLTSRFIDLNVLSVAPDTVMVNQACPELIRLLERNGFTVIPVQHRHRRLFGGGFHCFTLDLVRDGGPEDYLT